MNILSVIGIYVKNIKVINKEIKLIARVSYIKKLNKNLIDINENIINGEIMIIQNITKNSDEKKSPINSLIIF